MKKFLYIILLGILLVSCNNSQVEIIFEKHTEDLQISNDINKKLISVSYADLKTDNDILAYYLENNYAGFYQISEKGFSTKNFIEDFEKEFSSKPAITISNYYEWIVSYLSNFINDPHFTVQKHNQGQALSNIFYNTFSNIYVKKENEKFYVVESDNPEISLGDIYKDESEYLFYYPSKGEDIYRIGLFQNSPRKDIINLNFSDKSVDINLSLPECKSFSSFYTNIETNDSAYIHLNQFLPYEMNGLDMLKTSQILNDFTKISNRYRSKKNVILDLRNNGGGSSHYPKIFLSNLYWNNKIFSKEYRELVVNGEKISYLINDSIAQAIKKTRNKIYVKGTKEYKAFDFYLNPLKENTTVTFSKKDNNNDISPLANPRFEGKIILITNRNTASASEECIWFAKMLFDSTNQLVIVGENSLGCIEYGHPWSYELPNTGLQFGIPASKIDLPFFANESCVGYTPDIYTTDEDLIKTLSTEIDDKDLLSKLAKIHLH